jgi:hypothetical protein
MGFLENIISCMLSDEKADFGVHLVRFKDNPKENALYEALCVDHPKKQEEKISKLYQPPNPKAYSLLRVRLTEKLVEFIAIISMQKGGIYATNEPPAILVAQWLIDRNAMSEACKHLLRTEKNAQQNHQYDLLDSIYNLQLLHADEFGLDVNELKPRWHKNMDMHNNMRKLNALYADVRIELAARKRAGTTMDAVQWVNDIFAEFNFTRSALKNATFMLKLAEICRSAIISAKEYQAFEPYLIRVYENLKELHSFEGAQADCEASFVMMIAHTLYRERKFEMALQWLDKFERPVGRKIKSHKLFPKYIGLQIAILCYTNRNKEAIELTLQTLEDKSIKMLPKYRFDLQLNLAVYYFNEMNFKMANKAIMGLPKSDKLIEDTKGREWRFKKEMIEVIIQYELGNVEITRSRIKSMEKHYQQFLDHSSYQIAAIYLRQILKMIDHPEKVCTPEFAEEVRLMSTSWPAERLDIQAITFFCWLKSKIKQQNYYEVLLEGMSMNG